MYKIYADDILIYDDTSSDPFFKVASPRLTMEEGAAGSLQMTIAPGNAGYDYIVRMNTEIRVEKDGAWLWSGRPLQESMDFWNQRQITCEGVLAYFNDTIVPHNVYDFMSEFGTMFLIDVLLQNHNERVPDSRKIFPGVCLVHKSIHMDTDYGTTMEYLNKMVDECGGFLQIRRGYNSQVEKDVFFLDYMDKEENTGSQTIEFGKNLMDFTKTYDSTEYATVVVPLGAKQSSEEEEGESDYLTVASVNDDSIYVPSSQEAIDTYGWIERVVHWDDVTDPNQLLSLGQNYLSDMQFDTMVLEVSALDLHYLNPDIQGIRVGDMIRVVSAPHGIDRKFPVKKLDIPLDQPQNATIQLGDNVKVTLTSSSNKLESDILKAIETEINEDAILNAAKANAAAIMNMTLNGYVTVLTETDLYGTHSEGLYVSQSIPLKDDQGNFIAQRFWKWSTSGLGYTDDGGQTWKAAITMDGTIIGERIAAGSIHGSKITAGTLDIVTSSGQSGLSIGLSSRGMAPGSFVVGNIDQNGKNVDSTDRARSVMKIYLASGARVKLSNSNYWFEPMEYSDNNDQESGFERGWGESPDRTFIVSSANYYRFVVRKVTGGTISDNELNTIAAAFDLGGTTAVFTADDFQFLGAVTFTDLRDPASSTFINGSNIVSGTITANKINLKGIEIRSTKMDGKDVPEYTSFSVDENGEVTVNGKITLGEGSTITWDSVEDKPTYIEKNRIYSANIEGGTITGGTISGETIEGGTISGTTISGSTFKVRHSDGDIVFYPSEESTSPAGIITYYDQASASGNNPEGIAITAYTGHALKLTGGGSGGGLSLDGSGEGIYADDIMFLDHGFATARGVGFGTSAEKNALGSVREGYIFFQID